MRLVTFCAIYPGFPARTGLRPALDGILAIQLRDISPEGVVDTTRLARVHLDLVPDRYMVRSGDVVFRSRGQWNTASAIDEQLAERALAVMPLFILRPNCAIVFPEYLAWAINQQPTQRHFDATAQGGSMRMVPKSSLDELELDIPDLATQRGLIEISALAERERGLAALVAEKRKRLINLRLIEHAKAGARSFKPLGAHK